MNECSRFSTEHLRRIVRRVVARQTAGNPFERRVLTSFVRASARESSRRDALEITVREIADSMRPRELDGTFAWERTVAEF